MDTRHGRRKQQHPMLFLGGTGMGCGNGTQMGHVNKKMDGTMDKGQGRNSYVGGSCDFEDSQNKIIS